MYAFTVCIQQYIKELNSHKDFDINKFNIINDYFIECAVCSTVKYFQFSNGRFTLNTHINKMYVYVNVFN